MKVDVTGNGSTIAYWDVDAWVDLPDAIEIGIPSLTIKEVDSTKLTSKNKTAVFGIPTIEDITAKFQSGGTTWATLNGFVGTSTIYGIFIDAGGDNEYQWVFEADINIVEDSGELDALDTFTVSFAISSPITHTDPA